MDAQQITIARNSLAAAHDGTMSFPHIVGTLMQAGFEGYIVDYRRNTATYYLPDGDSLLLENPSSQVAVSTEFDAADVVASIKWAQANSADYSYLAFCKRVKEAGCAGYLVSVPGRRVLYYGRTGETHVEHFPQ